MTCTSPTETRVSAIEPPVPPPAGPSPPITSLRITAPTQLLVHETKMLSVTAHNDRGDVSVSPSQLTWTSSDTSIARVSADGILTAIARGSATIGVRIESILASVQLHVTARVQIARMWGAPPVFTTQSVSEIAIGDTLQYAAVLVDVNGFRIDAEPLSATWASSAPDVVSVTPLGLAIGLRHIPSSRFGWPNCVDCVTIIASTIEGDATATLFVDDVSAGLPATVRFANTASGRGPVTFVPTQGDPVTLAFGEFVDRPIKSGTFSVHVDGVLAEGIPPDGNQNFIALVREDDRLSLYAVTTPSGRYGGPAAVWSTHESVPADSGLVTLVAGSIKASVVYMRPSGAPISGIPELCYFDIGTATEFYRRAVGAFDIIVVDKFTSFNEYARISATVVAGHPSTLVIVGDSPESMRVLTFQDP